MPRKAKTPNFIDWRKSATRERIIQDLQPGGYLHDNNVDAVVAFEHYRNFEAFFNGVCLEQFKDRLRDHHKQLKAKPKRSNFIGWRKSAARQILLQDLTPPHGILVGLDEMSAEDLWDFYQLQEGFEKVPFEQFKLRLNDHRKQTNENRILSVREYQFLQHDRALTPRAEVNEDGEPIWHMHLAAKLLRKDVEKNRHVGKTPSQLQATRKEYEEFSEKVFKNHFYQAIKRKKFINYLEMKRNEKRKGIKMRDREAPNPILVRKRDDEDDEMPSSENPKKTKRSG